MSKTGPSPSPLAVRILSGMAEPDDRPSLACDVGEEYHDIRRRRGKTIAILWIWFQVFISLPSFLKNSATWRKTMLTNYLRTGWRNLKKHPGFSFISIAGLAAGMACCLLIFMWVQDELGYDRFHKNHGELHRLVINNEGNWWAACPWALAPLLKNELPEIRSATRYAERSVLISRGDAAAIEQAAFVDPEFLEMFTFPLVKGDSRTALSSTESAILTETAARRYFGNDDPLGKAITINNRQKLVVTGLIKDLPANSYLVFTILAPVKLFGEQVLTSFSYESESFVLLEKNASLEALRKKLAPIVMKYDKRVNTVRILDLQPLARIHLHGLEGGGPILYIYIFSTIAVFILLMACINFMNLSTALAGARAKEVGMRKVMGAGSPDVAKQYYGESLLHTSIALIGAIALVILLLPTFNALAQKQLSLRASASASVLLGLLGITLFTGLVSGSYPALFLSSFRPIVVLKGAFSAVSAKPRLRKILVVTQFSIAVILIVGTAVVSKQMTYIRGRNLGFNRTNVVSLPMNRAVLENYEALKNEVLRYSEVVNVTAATSRPTLVGNINPVTWEGQSPGRTEDMNFIATDHDYIKTFEMEIVAGRDFSRDFPTDKENYIVNEAAVRFMGLKNPVGKLFAIWNNRGRIIGVVKDFHSRPLHSEIRPVVITLSQDWRPSYLFVRIKPGNITQTMDFLQKTWRKFAQNYPFNPVFMDEAFERLYQSDRRMGTIFRDFAVLALFIACLGVFGLAAFAAQRRTKEIGVRKVLGATVPDIVSLLSREFLIMVTAANVIAWPIAYFLMNRLLRTYAYRTSLSVWVFLLAGGISYLIAMLTVSLQAFRAARTEPANALRYE